MTQIRLSAYVGNDYLDWKPGKIILISSPTGSGKTYFATHTLLNYAISQQKHIIYICNRSLLRNQTEYSLKNSYINESKPKSLKDKLRLSYYFHVTTYQHFENNKSFPKFVDQHEDAAHIINKDIESTEYCEYLTLSEDEMKSVDWYIHDMIGQQIYPKDVMYYIFDEAHYFVQDASFNLDAAYWNSSMLSQRESISVFLTATPEPLEMLLSLTRASSINVLEELAKKAYDTNETRKKLLEKERYDDPNDGNDPLILLFPTSTHMPTPLEVKFIRKANNPFQEFYKTIASIILNHNTSFDSVYSYGFDYSSVTPYYFSEYDDLTEKIVQTVKAGEKWLIFTDSIKKGKEYKEILNAVLSKANTVNSEELEEDGDAEEGENTPDSNEKSNVVFINRKTRDLSSKNHSKEVYDEIITNEKFKCPVLITTSVLDNGVNIKDSAVKHVVISATSKTTFLQMLGRVRDAEHLNLYIKSVPNLNLYGYIHENNQLLLALLPFVFKDKKQITEHETYQIDPYTYRIETEFFYSATMMSLRKTIRFLTHKRRSIDPLVIHYYDRSNNASDIISIQLNTPYFLHYLYQNYYYNKALDNGKHNPPQHAFLREQLRWIGKEYNPANWLGSGDVIEELQQFLLDELSKGVPKSEQNAFAYECLKKILQLKFTPQCLKPNISRFSENNPPKKYLLNKAFVELGIPYEIKSKTKGKKHETVWVIDKTDSTKFFLEQYKDKAITKDEFSVLMQRFAHRIPDEYIREKDDPIQYDESQFFHLSQYINEFIFPEYRHHYFLTFECLKNQKPNWHIVKDTLFSFLDANEGVVFDWNDESEELSDFVKRLTDKLIAYPLLSEEHHKHLIQYQNEKYPDIHMLDNILASTNMPFMFYELQDSSNKKIHFIYSQLRPHLSYLSRAQIPIKDYVADFFLVCINELTEIYQTVGFDKSKTFLKELESIYYNNDETAYTYNNTYLLAKNLCYLNVDYDFEYDKENNSIFVYEIASPQKEMRINHFNRIGYETSSIGQKIFSASGATGRIRRSYS